MENEEKNINENKELSLQEQLKAQDEFAFLDEEINQKTQEKIEDEFAFLDEEVSDLKETQEEESDNSLDLAKTQDLTEENEEEQSENSDINQEAQEEIFEDFPDKQIDEEFNEKPQLEINPNNLANEDFAPEQTDENSLITVRPIKFQEFADTPPNRTIKKNLDLIQDISMHVSVELGRTKSSIREVMGLEKGSIVELDKIAGEQVEIFVNQKLVAKGEVIVIEDKFGVRVTSTTNPKPQ